jgi:hypothetical protein
VGALVHVHAYAERHGFLQLGALLCEADFSEAEEDDAEDRAGVFLGFEAGVGAELVGGVLEAFFQGAVGCVFFGWCDPVHISDWTAGVTQEN